MSFLVEGWNAKNIEPLLYRINVHSRTTTCGPPDAINNLRAKKYLQIAGRRVRAITDYVD